MRRDDDVGCVVGLDRLEVIANRPERVELDVHVDTAPCSPGIGHLRDGGLLDVVDPDRELGYLRARVRPLSCTTAQYRQSCGENDGEQDGKPPPYLH